jgi:L-ribulose-5-phosphate 4-epimerase
MDNYIKAAKEDYLKAAKRADSSGIQTGNGGNISVRVANHELMVIKASGVSFIDSTFDNIAVTDYQGKVVSGSMKPSRELVLHAAIYRKFPHIGAVVHTHSPYAIAWSFSGQSIPLVTKHAQMKIKYPIPVLPVETPDVRPEHIPLVYELIEEKPDLMAFILQGHGIVAIAKDAITAEYNAELIEETAQIAWLHAAGKNIGIIP